VSFTLSFLLRIGSNLPNFASFHLLGYKLESFSFLGLCYRQIGTRRESRNRSSLYIVLDRKRNVQQHPVSDSATVFCLPTHLR
jgi:hypothetical protein